MWRSLKQHHASAVLHVACLSDECQAILAPLRLPDVHLHTIADIEARYPQLHLARENRTQIEFYFTLTPYLPSFVLETRPDLQRATYLDADLFFVSSPQPIFDEIGTVPIALIEHRFA